MLAMLGNCHQVKLYSIIKEETFYIIAPPSLSPSAAHCVLCLIFFSLAAETCLDFAHAANGNVDCLLYKKGYAGVSISSDHSSE